MSLPELWPVLCYSPSIHRDSYQLDLMMRLADCVFEIDLLVYVSDEVIERLLKRRQRRLGKLQALFHVGIAYLDHSWSVLYIVHFLLDLFQLLLPHKPKMRWQYFHCE